MKKPSDDGQQWDQLYEKVIGLGEKSIRKSYYPELQRKIRELQKEVEERKLREQELKRNYENRAVLNQLLKLSLEGISVNALCQITAEKLSALSWLAEESSVTILFVEDVPEQLELKASVGMAFCAGSPCQQIRFGECLCGQAAATGQVQFSSHIDDRHSIRVAEMSPHGHYCIPIILAGQTLGVISLYLPDGHPHDQREEDFFLSVANTLAGIIQRDRILNERNRYEAILSHTQKIEALGTLSGGIAHDFNNLLAPMLGYAELALRELEEGSKPAKFLHEIQLAATRARDLVKQILILSHKIEYRLDDLQPIEFEATVRDVLGLVRASIPTTVDIVERFDAAGQTVLVEPTHIHQVVLNLCTNAYHAMGEGGGTLTISLRKKSLHTDDLLVSSRLLEGGDYLLMEVADTGSGMDDETLERIFDPYFTTKKQGEGTGLGLSVVNGIVTSYGGHISVQSAPGQGTVFGIYLPCCECSEQAGRDLENVALPTGTEKIIVVDDELQVGEMTRASLDMLGYKTDLFLTGQEVINHFRSNPYDYQLIITDMTMPKMTGLDLMLQLRKDRDDIPIILCTGFSELINESKAREQGFQGYLMKPFSLRDLAYTVREVLDSVA